MAHDRILKAMANRSLRTIRAELDFLVDTSLISQDQLSTILAQLPADSSPFTSSTSQPQVRQPTPEPSPVPERQTSTRTSTNKNTNKDFYAPPSPQPQAQPPPSYDNTPPAPTGPSPLTYATALYAYSPADAGDLALSPNDRIAVLEFMNADWWKGRSERTGAEGIFPRAYVREDGLQPQPQNEKMGYGNGAGNGNMTATVVPVVVVQPGPSKGEEQAKKFGKKLGNAAIFGAGATIGSNLVNSIF